MKMKLLQFLMASVLNSFNKETCAKVYGGKKTTTTKTMLLSGLYIFEKYGKNFKLNLVRVLVLVLQSEDLQPISISAAPYDYCCKPIRKLCALKSARNRHRNNTKWQRNSPCERVFQKTKIDLFLTKYIQLSTIFFSFFKSFSFIWPFRRDSKLNV